MPRLITREKYEEKNKWERGKDTTTHIQQPEKQPQLVK
jgi:hypothetical protein